MNFDCFSDVYYTYNYVNLYLDSGDEPFEFYYEENEKWVYNISIKHPINYVGDVQVNEEIFDLETVYGYGGIFTNSRDKTFIKKALAKYREKCRKNNIIAEFFRFHPYNSFPVSFPDSFDFLSKDRLTIIINLNQSYDEIFKNFKSSLRRNIRKALKNGLVAQEVEKSDKNIEAFKKLYHHTMEKNQADNFYFFSTSYFNNLLEKEYAKLYGIFYDGKLINAGIFLFSYPFIYYHLGASDFHYYSLNGNALLFSELCRKYNYQYEIFYLGGGNTPDLENSLYKFKRKFSPDTRYFYIGGFIYNHEKYNELIDIWNTQHPDDNRVYFLKYRLK